MQKKYISRSEGCKRLLLLFAGWGMDWRPFRDLELAGYDIMVVWDYRDLTFNWQPYMAYDEVCLVAWSMGVFAASLTVHELLPRITKRIAVNGTLEPIDNNNGIPPAVFQGTINALAPHTLRKFYRRMCISADQFAAFSANMPRRTVAELVEELREIETNTIFHVPQVEEWDLAVVSRHDAIFPTQNQVNAWRSIAPIQFMEAAHLPDFKMLLSRLIIDKDRVRRRFSGARSSYTENAVVQERIARALFARFQRVAPPQSLVGNIIEVGCGNGALTQLYASRMQPGTALRLWDLVESDAADIAPDAQFTACDAEVQMRKVPTASVNVIFSASTVQWFNSPASFLRDCARALTGGGYLVLSTFVRGNLQEISDVIGAGLQLPLADGWRRMVPPQMELLVCETAAECISFDTPRQVIEHLRHTGVNAVEFGRGAVTSARALLERFPRDREGRCTLTYRPIYLIMRKLDD